MFPYHRLSILIIFLANVSQGDGQVNSLKHRLTKAAAQYRSQQALCLKSEEKLKSLEWEQTQKTSLLEKKLLTINGYLSALKKIQLIAPTAILNSSMTPQRLIQSTIILNAFIRHILKSTQNIRSELDMLVTMKDSIKKEKLSAKGLAEKYNEKHKEIEDLLLKRRHSLKQEIKNRKALESRINTLATESRSLHDLIQRLESAEQKTRTTSAPERDGSFVLPKNAGSYQVRPVIGPVISTFGKKHPKLDTEGAGIVFQTQPNSLVYSPINAKVAYAGPFRKYNHILILGHDNRYHTLVIGLKQIDVSVGQVVLAGEPIGYVGEDRPSYLYVELRDREKPIDPLPWFKGAQ